MGRTGCQHRAGDRPVFVFILPGLDEAVFVGLQVEGGDDHIRARVLAPKIAHFLIANVLAQFIFQRFERIAVFAQRPEQRAPAAFEDGLTQFQVQFVDFGRAQPGGNARCNNRAGGCSRRQPRQAGDRFAQRFFEHRKRLRDDDAANPAAVNSDGYVFRKGFIFSSCFSSFWMAHTK